jgi:CD36 family
VNLCHFTFISLATYDQEREPSVLFMGEASAPSRDANLPLQHNKRGGLSQRRGQEVEGRRSWSLRLSVSVIRSRMLATNFLHLREILENKNATFHENGTLSFVPSRHSIPIPERSIGDPHKDIIVAPNLPLIGFSNTAAKLSSFAALSFSTLAKTTSSQPILNLTVHDYLWGYSDNLISFARTILPNYVNFDRFGLMDRVSR